MIKCPFCGEYFEWTHEAVVEHLTAKHKWTHEAVAERLTAKHKDEVV